MRSGVDGSKEGVAVRIDDSFQGLEGAGKSIRDTADFKFLNYSEHLGGVSLFQLVWESQEVHLKWRVGSGIGGKLSSQSDVGLCCCRP